MESLNLKSCNYQNGAQDWPPLLGINGLMSIDLMLNIILLQWL